MNDIIESKWYEDLIEECKDIITEAIFTSRWALVEGYWNLGKRIREDANFQEYSKGNHSSLQDLARNLNIAERTIYYAIQCFDTYSDIQKLPEGKNITWNKLITKYLPTHKEEKILTPQQDLEITFQHLIYLLNDPEIEKITIHKGNIVTTYKILRDTTEANKSLVEDHKQVAKIEHKEAVDMMLAFWEWTGAKGKPDDTWRAREITHAKKLIKKGFNIDKVLVIAKWRVQDPFWKEKLTSLGSIYSHISDWVIEKSNTTKKSEGYISGGKWVTKEGEV